MAAWRAGVGRSRRWPPPGGPYRDERLAFLAAAPELRRRQRRGSLLWFLITVALAFLTTLLDPDTPDAKGVDPAHVLACEEAAQMLDALERQRLRERGELPNWFFAEVERLAIRKH